MLGNKLKATLVRYCELSVPVLTQLKAWMKRAPRFQFTDTDTFNASSLRVAVATNDKGEPQSITIVEKMLFCSGFAVRPDAGQDVAMQAGAAIDRVIEQQAALEGISKIFLVAPSDFEMQEDGMTREIKNVRLFLRSVPQTTIAQGTWGQHRSTAARYLN